MEIQATCRCGRVFILDWRQFSIWTNSCECCGDSHHLEITCPGCKKTLVLQKANGED